MRMVFGSSIQTEHRKCISYHKKPNERPHGPFHDPRCAVGHTGELSGSGHLLRNTSARAAGYRRGTSTIDTFKIAADSTPIQAYYLAWQSLHSRTNRTARRAFSNELRQQAQPLLRK